MQRANRSEAQDASSHARIESSPSVENLLNRVVPVCRLPCTAYNELMGHPNNDAKEQEVREPIVNEVSPSCWERLCRGLFNEKAITTTTAETQQVEPQQAL